MTISLHLILLELSQMHFMMRPRSSTHLLRAGLVHCVTYDAMASILIEIAFFSFLEDNGAVLMSVALLIALSAVGILADSARGRAYRVSQHLHMPGAFGCMPTDAGFG